MYPPSWTTFARDTVVSHAIHLDCNSLVIIRNFNFKHIMTTPSKTNPVLIINPDAVLSLPIAAKSFESVPGRDS